MPEPRDGPDAERAALVGEPAPADEQRETPLPLRKLAVLLLLSSTDAIAFTQIFPYIAYMVVDFGLTDDTREVGNFAGYLAASYSLAQFASSYFWGAVSDRLGRRPVLLMGLAGTIVSTLLFGFAQSFEVAIVARSLWGLGNANVGTVKTYLGEITDSSNEARGFSLLGLAGSIGRIVGPVIGGYLARPAESFPAQFAGTVFEQYPYLLPSLSTAALSLLGLGLGFFCLEETLVSRAAKAPAASASASASKYKSLELSRMEASSSSEGEEGEEEEEEEEQGDDYSIFRDGKVLFATGIYCALGLWTVVFWEVTPQWAVDAPAQGGVGFSQQQIGTLNAICGASMMAFQLLVYPAVARRCQPLRLFALGGFLSAPLLVCMSLTPYVAGAAARFWLVNLLFAATQWCLMAAYTSVFQIVRQCTAPEHLGAANGLGQSLVALTRTVGPVGGSVVLAWSLTNGLAFPFDEHFVFLSCAALSVLTALLAYLPVGRSFLTP